VIGPLLRLNLLNFVRDRPALLLSFVLPVVFFAIFAGIFGGMAGDDGMPKVEVVVVDEDGSETSRRFAAALIAEPSFKGPRREDARPTMVASREEARGLVGAGTCDVALVLPAGFGKTFGALGGAETARVVLFADATANPVGYRVVQGLLQKIAMTAAPDLMVRRGMAMFERYGGPLTPEQQRGLDQYLPMLRGASPGTAGTADGPAADASAIAVELEDVRAREQSADRRRRFVAFQAAGIGVMFLLFSVTGAAGSLLQEEQTGTLQRLLTTGVGMGRLLLGYWLFALAMGALQLFIMFTFGWAVFGLELFTAAHFSGFVVMTLVTAAAAAAFGLVLGTAARTQAQLGGISTIVILVMSALGGSMVPRFLLQRNPLLDKVGLVTFNAWAIDGYQKVFWYETGLASLWPQVTVLAAITAACLAVARLLARRWEAA
jgi:ABC-2 type transport system permease protein